MRERPILFSAPMVRAILDGRKSQTRRIVKPPPGYRWLDFDGGTMINDGGHKKHISDMICKHGQPGDLLYVKEAWRVSSRHDDLPPRSIPHTVSVEYLADDIGHFDGRYRHARFMPRWASRITLEISGVRVERLQDISESDALAEGIMPFDSGYASDEQGMHDAPTASESYGWLSEQINGAYSWDKNPWVWVIEFKRIDA